MKSAYSPSFEDQDVFRRPDLLYSQAKQELISRAWLALDHGDVERQLTDLAREVVRELLQSHLTLRGQAEALAPVVGTDGEERTHVRRGETRQLKTTFGPVRVSRTAYSGRSQTSLHPVDADLNLPANAFSHEVQRLGTLGAVQLSYERAAEFLRKSTGAHVAKRQLESIVSSAAVDFDSFYELRRWCPDLLKETGPFLVLSFDQKGIVVKHHELRAKTRRIAEGSRPRIRAVNKRNGKKRWRGKKRMATVGVVYSIQPDHRTPTDVVRGLRRLTVKTGRHQRTVQAEHKRVLASLERTAQEVISDGFSEALSRDPHQGKTWFVLVDGDPELRTWVMAEAEKRGVKVTLVLDVIHALQYLWGAGEALCGKDETSVEAWVLPRLERILAGKVSDVVAGMRRAATKLGLTRSQRKAVDKCANYYLKRKEMMRYGELLAVGAPIATGAIEGSCKHLINDRCDLCGARWTVKGAEAILKLRATFISGDFDEYWKYHEGEERKRNHESRYLEGRPTPVGTRGHLRAIK